MTQPMFERMGGAIGVDRLVERFYGLMEDLPQARAIRAMHPDDLGPIKATLKRYLSEWTGGPKLYSPQKGHPRLRQRHIGFPIDEAARDAWLVCMRGALADVVADDDARRELDATLSKLADWIATRAAIPMTHRSAAPHSGRPK